MSTHFTDVEFDCKCGCVFPDEFKLLREELLMYLDRVRQFIAKPITITSGYRCKRHNTMVGGAIKSQHLLGRAVDIAVHGYTGEQLKDVFEGLIRTGTIKDGGIGTYKDRPSILHFDLGPPRRW